MVRTVLVTGASRGIGKTIALSAGRLGYNVAVNYFKSAESASEICETIKACGVKAVAVRADVADINQVDQMFKTIKSELGAVDILINNAGVSASGVFQSMDIRTMRKVMDVNFWGACNCIYRFAPAMISARFGRIVNISSIWGVKGASCEAVYSASKAALIGLTEGLAKEFAPSGVTVNAVAPGIVDTDMMKDYSKEELRAMEQSIPAGRFAKPMDIAQAVMSLVSAGSGYITGQTIVVDGGYL